MSVEGGGGTATDGKLIGPSTTELILFFPLFQTNTGNFNGSQMIPVPRCGDLLSTSVYCVVRPQIHYCIPVPAQKHHQLKNIYCLLPVDCC